MNTRARGHETRPPGVSVAVAICTWNRSDLLKQTLEQMTRLAIPGELTWEVLVVNNNCTDDTDAVIGAFAPRLPIRRVFEAHPGLSRARNAALDAASGDYILFTDDDVLVDEAWLVEFAAAVHAYPEAAVIGGAIEPWFPIEPDPDLLRAFPWLATGFCGLDHHRGPGVIPDGLNVYGANMSYRRSAVQSQRFNVRLGVTPVSQMGGEEIEFVRHARRAGGQVVWWPTMRVRHHIIPSRMTVEYCLTYMRAAGTRHVVMDEHRSSGPSTRVPRWLVRMYLEARVLGVLAPWVRYQPHRYWSGPRAPERSSRRVRRLVWRRERAWLRGMIDGYRRARGPV